MGAACGEGKLNQSSILDAVCAGRAICQWVPLTGTGLQVMPDALRIEGVRVSVSARTEQQIADYLTEIDSDGWRVSLLTPELSDLIWQHAAHRLDPVTLWRQGRDISEWRWTLEHSRQIDEQLTKLGAQDGEIVATVGKDWCLTANLSESVACNHGWHQRNGHPIQNQGHQHSPDHHDYSQTVRLVRIPPGASVPGLSGSIPQRHPGVPLVSRVRDTEPVSVDSRPLHVRSLDVALEEAKRWGCDLNAERSVSQVVPLSRIAEYFETCERAGSTAVGKWLASEVRAGKRYSFCAAAVGWCEGEAAQAGDCLPPHRAGALEIQQDALQGRRGDWLSIEEVRTGECLPGQGDIVVHTRDGAGKGHVERVVSADSTGCRTVGANEDGGRWVIERLEYSAPLLLGFVMHREMDQLN